MQPSHTGEQRVQLPHGGALRHQPVDAGGHDVGDGVAEQQEVVVQLGGDAVHRYGGGAVEPRQQLPVDRPVHVIHHDADEYIHREAEHLPQQLEVIAVEGKGHPQLPQAVADIQNAAEDGEDQGYDGQRPAAVADDQQRDHDEGIQHLLAHGHDLLEQILLVDGHMGFKHADGEGQRCVDRHDPQQLLRQRNLVGGQLFAEDHVAVGQAEADDQHQRPQKQIGGQEHAVELGTALFVSGGTETGVVPHIGAAQAEAQQVQVGDDGQHRLIDAEFAFAQPLQHNGRIDKRDDGAKAHRHIGQHRSRLDLIDLHAVAPFTRFNILLYPVFCIV